VLANRNNLHHRITPTAVFALALVVASMDAGPLAAIATIAAAPPGVAVPAPQVPVPAELAAARELTAVRALTATQESSTAQ
jgi:hypothetical protein